MSNLRLGVIGAGGIACRRTIPEVVRDLDNVAIASVMDINPATAEQVAKEFDVPHYCSTEAELLDRDDVDAVYIATPQNAHCKQALMAAEAGKHVLCEKPMAVSVAECRRMEAACKEAKVKFMLGFCMRYNAYNQKALDLARAGKFGQFVMGRAQLTCWYPPIPGAWRQDISVSHGGSLLDMGTHCLDLLEQIMGASVREVFAFQNRLTHDYPTEIEDTSTVLARFENNAHGIVDTYFNLPDAAAQNSLEIHGTTGSLIGKGTIGQDPTGEMFTIFHEQGAYNANQVRDTKPEHEEYHLEGKGIYGTLVGKFAEAVLNDTEPEISFADGIHSAKVVAAIYQSAREGRAARVDEIGG